MPDAPDVLSRLDRIERQLADLSFLRNLVNPVDPSPEDIARLRGDPEFGQLAEALRQLVRIPHRGDPAPSDRVRWGVVQARLADLLTRNPSWFSDPPPEDFLNVRVLDLIRRWRGGFSDPAPDDLGGVRLRDLLQRIPGGGISDPSPEDLGRLSKTEVETQLHRVSSELVRLRALERLLDERLKSFEQK